MDTISQTELTGKSEKQYRLPPTFIFDQIRLLNETPLKYALSIKNGHPVVITDPLDKNN